MDVNLSVKMRGDSCINGGSIQLIFHYKVDVTETTLVTHFGFYFFLLMKKKSDTGAQFSLPQHIYTSKSDRVCKRTWQNPEARSTHIPKWFSLISLQMTSLPVCTTVHLYCMSGLELK